MIVVDASTVVELLLRRRAYAQVADTLLVPGQVLHAPHLLDVEVTQVLRRFARTGSLAATRAEEALDDLRALRVVRHPTLALLGRVWGLRENLSAYDALHIALAEALEAPLLTMDRRIARAPGHTAQVVVAG